MTAIVDNLLYLASFEEAQEMMERQQKPFDDDTDWRTKVRRVVSLGCTLCMPHEHEQEQEQQKPPKHQQGEQHPHVEDRLEFDQLLDQPESAILQILEKTDQYITQCLTARKCVLVHCVYGQSRSAAVIVSYLMSTSKYSLEGAIALVKLRRPQMCINPGFLAQLFLISQRPKGFLSAEARLIISSSRLPLASTFSNVSVKSSSSSSSSSSSNPAVADAAAEEQPQDDLGYLPLCPPLLPHPCPSRQIVCHSCRHPLALESDLLQPLDCTTFLSQHVDDYWKGYRPLHTSLSSPRLALPLKGALVTAPLRWMLEQVDQHHRLSSERENKVPSSQRQSRRQSHRWGENECEGGEEEGIEGGRGTNVNCLSASVGPLSKHRKVGESTADASAGARAGAGCGGEAEAGTSLGSEPAIRTVAGTNDGGCTGSKAGTGTVMGSLSELIGAGVVLRCPNPSCSEATLGMVRIGGLELCHGFLRCDFYALEARKVILRA